MENGYSDETARFLNVSPHLRLIRQSAEDWVMVNQEIIGLKACDMIFGIPTVNWSGRKHGGLET
ncbi:MAG: hypothetical protein ACLFWL_15065 [Candidatus Brocadiia bacterium]